MLNLRLHLDLTVYQSMHRMSIWYSFGSGLCMKCSLKLPLLTSAGCWFQLKGFCCFRTNVWCGQSLNSLFLNCDLSGLKKKPKTRKKKRKNLSLSTTTTFKDSWMLFFAIFLVKEASLVLPNSSCIDLVSAGVSEDFDSLFILCSRLWCPLGHNWPQ